jgi:hypothetical protein
MSDNSVLALFKEYQALQAEIREKGVNQVLNDLLDFYPDVYSKMEKEFKHRQKVKELGALLVDSTRR